MEQTQNRNKGIFFIISAAFFFALMGLFVRLSGDLPAAQKSFFRNIIAFAVAIGTLKKSGKKIDFGKGNLPYFLIRSLAGTVGIWCNFYAVDHLVLADASMLNKMSPFFVVIFSALILKEKVMLKQWMAVLVAFIGSLFVIKPTFTNMDLKSSLIGFAGGAAAGLAYTFVRKLGERGIKGPLVVAFFSGFSCLAMLPFVIANYTPMSGKQILFLLCAGLAATGGQFSVTAAYFHAPAREISVYDYSQIIFSTLFGVVVFRQMPDGWSFLGYIIILATAVWMFMDKRKGEV